MKTLNMINKLNNLEEFINNFKVLTYFIKILNLTKISLKYLQYKIS